MDAGGLNVWKDGVAFKTPETDHGGRLQKHLLPLGRAKSLTELAQDYAFFTPAILYLHGYMTDDPLVDFLHEYQQNVEFFFYRFDRRIFAGLDTSDGDVDWNHAVWAVRREHWEAFKSFYLTVAVAVPDSNYVNKIGRQVLHVIDPLAVDKATLVTGRLPVVEVDAFGVDGSLCRLAFEEGINPLTNIPRLRKYPPTRTMVDYAKAFFKGDNPEYVLDKLSMENLWRNQLKPNSK